MAREISRVAMGYFPTQGRIVAAIANLINPSPNGTDTVLDAGCGEGKALEGLRTAWKARAPNAVTKLYGIESDRGRHGIANDTFAPSGGNAIWSSIEDVECDTAPSLLYFNPPYDRIRGGGRLELLLFNRVRHWVDRGGYLVLIVPDYILSDFTTGLAVSVERDYKLVSLYRYPEPEYQAFKQCVLIAERRDRALSKNYISMPQWAIDEHEWPVLPLRGRPVVTLKPASGDVTFRRTNLGKEIILDSLSRSPLRSSLLRESLAPPPVVERPLLPLRDGHLALALAGGLCDGVIEDTHGERFLVKGTLESRVCKVATKPQVDAYGRKTGDIETHRTKYCMNVRCLRENGSIEDYSSNEGEEMKDIDEGEGDDAE